MRSSKQRSRSKQNRNRSSSSVGNVVNRVFDSSGPEGKVRGTPQQIIDKYNQLARDSQLSGDRVATENFQQHSEHYTRMLADAMREQEAKREAQEAQHRERQQQQQQRNQERDEQREANQQPQPHSQQPQSQQPQTNNPQSEGGQPNVEAEKRPDEQPRPARAPRSRSRNRPEQAAEQPPVIEASTPQPDVVDVEPDSGLVETPESKPEPKPKAKPKPRRPRKKPVVEAEADAGAGAADAETPKSGPAESTPTESAD